MNRQTRGARHRSQERMRRIQFGMQIGQQKTLGYGEQTVIPGLVPQAAVRAPSERKSGLLRY